MPKKSFKWTHDGIEYTIKLSNRPEKKLMGTFINPETKRENNIYFGGIRPNGQPYEHFYDRTGLLKKDLNHLDEERRQRYRDSHKNDNLDKPSSGLLSMNLLW